MTHYVTLGVTETATADEIKRAYRKLASQHHPDRGGDTATFQNIQSAYDILSDDNKRQQYDLERSGHAPGVQFHWHGGHPDINTIFQQFGFGGDPFAQFRQQQQQQRRNRDLRIELLISLAETLTEQTRVVSVQTTNGHRETVEVRIPTGVTSGTNIKYSGLGDNMFNNIPRGDLLVQIQVQPDPNFSINNIDLHTQVRVNCLLAITGGTATVTGIDDRSFILTIPPGTQPGVKFRFAHQGLYQMNSTQRGDLYVELLVSIPQNFDPTKLEIVRGLLNS